MYMYGHMYMYMYDDMYVIHVWCHVSVHVHFSHIYGMFPYSVLFFIRPLHSLCFKPTVT